MLIGVTTERRLNRRMHQSDREDDWLGNRFAAFAVLCALGGYGALFVLALLGTLSGFFRAQ